MLLVVVKGSNAGRDYLLLDNARTIIGRGKDCNIRILDLLVSRNHCKIEGRDGTFYVDDLNSTNKTLLNGKEVDNETKLDIGDTIKIGDTLLLFTDKKDTDIKNVTDFDLLIKGQTRILDLPTKKMEKQE